MNRIVVRSTSAILAFATTVAVMKGITLLAEFEAPTRAVGDRSHVASVVRRIQSGVGSVASALSTPALAQDAEHRLGEHPAIIVKRRSQSEGYDYTSKFYPHPAWLYLAAEAPRPMMDHPAVIVAKRMQEQAREATAKVEAMRPIQTTDAGEPGTSSSNP